MSVAVSVAATGTVERVVVVVLNWNREADTRECLASLDADRSAPHTILLVDNASEDDSGARLHAHFPGVAYLQTAENLGYAGGNNAGIAWALDHGAEFVFVLNNDTVVPAGCLQTLLAALESSPAMAAVAPTIVRHAHPDQMWWAGGHFSATKGLGVSHLDSPRPDAPALVPCTFLSGCALLMRAEALRSLGGFRADYFAYLEDVVKRPAHLIGYSDGGIITLLVAINRPDLVKTITLIGANYKADMGQPSIEEWEPDEEAKAKYARYSPDPAHTLVEKIKKMVQIWRTEPNMTLAQLGQIKCPALVIAGDDDVMSLAHTNEIYEAIENSRLAIIPASSHLIDKDQPELLNKVIRDFLLNPELPVTLMPVRRKVREAQ